MSQEAKLGSRDCLRTWRVAARCDSCGGPAEPVHMPLKLRGFYCQKCCSACAEPPDTAEVEAAIRGAEGD